MSGPQPTIGFAAATTTGRFRSVGCVLSTSTAVYMTYEPEFFEPGDRVIQWCGLPTRTERLVVAVWDLDGGPGSSATPVVRQAFDFNYGFILRQ